MSILNKYKRWVPILRIDTSNQLDMVLSQDNTPSVGLDSSLNTDCLISYIDTRNNECIIGNDLMSSSDYTYDKCVNNGSTLSDIVLTGLDNGFINLQDVFDGRTKDQITNKEYYNYLINFKNHPVTIDADDYHLYLFKVTGNTQQYSYESQLINDGTEQYYKLMGGFFQGFYKLDGFDYQVLPQYIENTWNMEFVIRPKDYSSDKDYDPEELLNTKHENTDGIFFFMGSRAENKFARFYKNDWNNFERRPGCNNDCDGLKGNYFYEKDKNKRDEQSEKLNLLLLSWLYTPYENHNGMYQCGCKYVDIFSSEHVIEKDSEDYNPGDYSLEEYLEADMDLTDMEITEMSDGKPIDLRDYFEITTDNKYLLFNHTHDGFTTKTFDEDAEYVFTGTTRELGINQYLLFNHTKHGYTTKNIWQFNNDADTVEIDGIELKMKDTTYNTINDDLNNAFALRVKSDGSVGYRYMIKDCENENGWSVREEYSYPGIIKQNEWNVVNIMFTILNGSVDNCGNPIGQRKMRIYIYVNGYLKLVSQELPELSFHALNDTFDKQEGVPFSISLGGGTQGLAETMWIDRNECFPYILPLEKYFAGSFIGDFRSFKFYTCKMESTQIKNNYYYETGENICQ